MSGLTGQSTSASRCPDGCECAECREWDADAELNAEDLEARLEAAWERADERSERQGDLIEMFRREI
jgi:hypothetical protein